MGYYGDVKIYYRRKSGTRIQISQGPEGFVCCFWCDLDAIDLDYPHDLRLLIPYELINYADMNSDLYAPFEVNSEFPIGYKIAVYALACYDQYEKQVLQEGIVVLRHDRRIYHQPAGRITTSLNYNEES